jgi:hypothetical protein
MDIYKNGCDVYYRKLNKKEIIKLKLKGIL